MGVSPPLHEALKEAFMRAEIQVGALRKGNPV